MTVTVDRSLTRVINPFHAALLAATVPLFLGGLLSDMAYASSYQIQWDNFAAWLIVGGMVFTGFALLWSFIELFRVDARRGRPLLCFFLLLAIFVLGFINSFIHARDAWGGTTGLILSAIITLLAIIATWIGFSSLYAGLCAGFREDLGAGEFK